jgi:hypothetical protein
VVAPAPAPAPAPPATTPPASGPAAVGPAPTQLPSADLAVSVNGNGPGSSSVTVVVANLGPQAAAAPRVELALRRGARNVPAGCSSSANGLVLTCSLGTVAAYRHGGLTIGVVDGSDVVYARVLSSTSDPVPANNVWSVVAGMTLDRPLSPAS